MYECNLLILILQDKKYSSVQDLLAPPNQRFTLGETFSSYEQLQAKIKLYECIQLSHRDSRTLEAARKRAPNRVEGANKNLKYYTIHMVCVFGGKKYKNRGTGQRAYQRYVVQVTQHTHTPLCHLSQRAESMTSLDSLHIALPFQIMT